MLKAKDIMSRKLVTVSPETRIYNAIQLLVNYNITGLPVVGENMSLLGMITEKDMLRLLYDTDIEMRSVKDLMSTKLVTFDKNTDLSEIIETFTASTFRRVPILDGEKLVGLISRKDIVKLIFKLKNQNN